MGGNVAAAVREPGTRLRADARRNRDRIVTAAREMFAEHGVDVPLDDVARRAGVGNATLYRHFPDRGDLVHHVVLSVLERITEHGEAALAEEADAFATLRRFVHAAAEEKAAALCTLLSQGVDRFHPEMVKARERMERTAETLVAQAHEAGLLRVDVGAGDLMMAVTQLARPLPGTDCTISDRFVHRHLDVLLDGLRDLDPTPLAGSPASLDDLRKAAAEDASAGGRAS